MNGDQIPKQSIKFIKYFKFTVSVTITGYPQVSHFGNILVALLWRTFQDYLTKKFIVTVQ